MLKIKSKIIFFSTSRVYSIKSIYHLILNKKNLTKKINIKNKYLINEKFDMSAPLSFYGLSKNFQRI